jgi:DNA-binding transcriptional ArsR family regulator
MDLRRDVFQAIADPTRRRIIGLIAQKPMNVTAISEAFDVSRQAVSLHVKILTECGLIVITQQGRERYCEAKLGQLREVSNWIDQYRQFWEYNFNSLEKYLTKTKKKHANKKTRN